jgi:hypothetical protein
VCSARPSQKTVARPYLGEPECEGGSAFRLQFHEKKGAVVININVRFIKFATNDYTPLQRSVYPLQRYALLAKSRRRRALRVAAMNDGPRFEGVSCVRSNGDSDSDSSLQGSALKDWFASNFDFDVEQVFFESVKVGIDAESRSVRKSDFAILIRRKFDAGEVAAQGGRVKRIFAKVMLFEAGVGLDGGAEGEVSGEGVVHELNV